MNRHFTIENMQITDKLMKIFSTSLTVRETNTKTTMSYYYTPNRMAKIKKKIKKIVTTPKTWKELNKLDHS